MEHNEEPWRKRSDDYVYTIGNYYVDNKQVQPSHYLCDSYGQKYTNKTETICYVENPAELNKEKGNRPLTDLKEDPSGTFHIPVINHSVSKVMVKVRLQITDDGDFVIPYEPAFDEAGELRWIAQKGRFENPRSTQRQTPLKLSYYSVGT